MDARIILCEEVIRDLFRRESRWISSQKRLGAGLTIRPGYLENPPSVVSQIGSSLAEILQHRRFWSSGGTIRADVGQLQLRLSSAIDFQIHKII
jgi:hypothetical protein